MKPVFFEDGADVVECRVQCEYNGKDIRGIVENYRTVGDKGTLFVVRVSNGYKSFYLNDAKNVRFHREEC